MKLSLFPKLAWIGIRNNRKLYVPYLLTCVGMVMMQYIVGHLSASNAVLHLRGGRSLCETLSLGNYVVALFAFLFLTYSNSFLMRRRKKEFGLYNILGMGKKHLAVVLFWETLMTAVFSMSSGLVVGVALSKTAELCIVNFMDGSIGYELTPSVDSIVTTLVVYALVFFLILLRALWQIRKNSALSLLRSENTGEKLPRFYGFWGILGMFILAAAYYLAVSIDTPLGALTLFFVAVVMVIAATYLLFISGSVLLCRLLQKNKRYYYQANHFVSVSSMAYRMTRNGAGLASICILLTMVLVMLSSTSCLFFGTEDSLRARYPRQITLNAHVDALENATDDTLQPIEDYILDVSKKHGATPENILNYRAVTLYGQFHVSELETDVNQMVGSLDADGDVWTVNFIPLEDYNRLSNEEYVLAPNEALLYSFRGSYTEDMLSVRGADVSFQIRERLDDFPVDSDGMSSISSSVYVVVPDFQLALAPLCALISSSGGGLDTHYVYYYDVNADDDVQIAIYEDMCFSTSQLHSEHIDYVVYGSRADERSSFIGLYAGLLMLGVILSVVFLFAAVLMIYYKQITEGYEDQSRFDVMRKVGMTQTDIRKSINSQTLTIFLLPILTAGIHMLFAFPLICRLLFLFNMTNTALFAQTSLISYTIFGLFYIVVYRITSNAYYSIVSGARSA